MIFSKRLHAATLLCLTIVVLAACGGKDPVSREDQQAEAFADLRAAVTESVADSERQKEVLSVVDMLEKDIDELRAILVKRREELRELNADYDATREDFLVFTRKMEERIQKGRQTALERHRELVASLTAEEWASLAKAETRAMKSIAKSIQGI